MKIRLLMLVERDPQGRFTGVIFREGPERRPGLSARAGRGVSGDG